ncbi:hypothetical protein Tco_1040840 [Tanacetum coccineum]|uniref:Uncharacterized protein n=1 Tax=Tanacetum coccineum TaxID=301880 RepID=A0ABQ5GFX7_9ASTR
MNVPGCKWRLRWSDDGERDVEVEIWRRDGVRGFEMRVGESELVDRVHRLWGGLLVLAGKIPTKNFPAVGATSSGGAEGCGPVRRIIHEEREIFKKCGVYVRDGNEVKYAFHILIANELTGDCQRGIPCVRRDRKKVFSRVLSFYGLTMVDLRLEGYPSMMMGFLNNIEGIGPLIRLWMWVGVGISMAAFIFLSYVGLIDLGFFRLLTVDYDGVDRAMDVG